MRGELTGSNNSLASLQWLFSGIVAGIIILTLGATLAVHFTPAIAKFSKQPATAQGSGAPNHSAVAPATSQTPQTKVSTVPTKTINLSIVATMTMPDGSTMGPTYLPTTSLYVPAHSMVTVTIVNYDIGDTDLPAGSPFANVSNVVGGSAKVDGSPYTQLDITKVAHTFTIPQLNVNVPIPGDSPTGASSLTVTFSFMTGAPGVYDWRCMDPCGSGSSGWGGPMATMGQMEGTLTVVA